MTKIMLVEDDNNLREIYGARLMAEGYQIVSAADGEEALALAVKEKPELIVADVMMPKISGFDMLDILRTTPETKNTKVIIMTALSQPEDRARGESLGADKYLVKSQVTLEDVVAAVHEILGDGGSGAAPSANVNETMPAPPPAQPATANPQMPEPPAPAMPPADNDDATSTPPTEPPQDADEEPPKAEGAIDAPEPASKRKRVIQPLNDLGHERDDFLKMVAEEEAREKQATPGASVGPTDDVSQEEQQAKMAATMAEEKKQMEEDVKKMVNDGTIDDEAAATTVQPDTAAPNGAADQPAPPVPQPPAEPAADTPAATGPDQPPATSEEPAPGSSFQPQAPTAAPTEEPTGSDTPAAPAPAEPPAPTEDPPTPNAPNQPSPQPGPNDIAL